jgi:hypothetical protein
MYDRLAQLLACHQRCLAQPLQLQCPPQYLPHTSLVVACDVYACWLMLQQLQEQCPCRALLWSLHLLFQADGWAQRLAEL